MYSSFDQTTWRPQRSVKLRFALAQGGFIAVVIAALAATLYFPVKDRFVSITNGSYITLAETLAPSLYDSFQTGDRPTLASVVHRVDVQRGVRYVVVTDSSNVVIYDTLTGPESVEGESLPLEMRVTDSQLTKGQVVKQEAVRGSTNYYNFVAPFIVGSKVLYTVTIGVDIATIDGEFNRLAQLFVYLGAAGIVIGIFAAYFLTARLTKPITQLTESALAIRAGNLNAYPAISTNDELEQLSREFRGMVERLKQFYFQEYTQKKEALHAKEQLQEINDRLEALSRQKTDFMNAASHQLRTPLSVIHWSLSLIVDEAEHLDLKPEHKELLTESLKSTKRMVDLVNDLLDLSRIEQGRKELQWGLANFGKVCDDLVKALQVLAHNKNLTLTYEQVGTIPDSFLDEKSFYQVVNNFVDNAIKYTAEGYVKVRCEKVGENISIQISDSGIGMTETERNDLFTRFSRGNEAQKMFPNGSGLGMFVARSLLHQHGGTVEVASEKGKGTTFTLIVPLYPQIPNPLPHAEEQEVAHA